MKIVSSFLLACLWFALLGCSYDSSYEAEKAFWEARKLDRKMHEENPEGLKEKHYEQIIAALEKVVNLAPMENLAAQAQFQIAQIYLGIEKSEQALETLGSVFRKFSVSEYKSDNNARNTAAQALFWIGRIHEGIGELDEAEKAYVTLIDSYPLTKPGLEVLIHMMRYHKSQGDISKIKEVTEMARSHYQTLIDKYSGTATAETVEGYLLQIYAIEGAWQDVLNFWETEIDTKLERSEKIRAKIAKANLLASQMKNIPEAERIYRDLVERYPVEPITPFIKTRLGHLLLAASKTEEAREIFNNISVEYPEIEELIIQSRFGLASADLNDGEYEKAIKSFDDIYAEYPENASTLRIPLMKYIYYRKLGKTEDEIEETLEAALSDYSSRWNRGGLTRSDQAAGRHLFLCLIQKKDWEAAATHFKSFTKRFPNDPSSLKLAKTLYWKSEGDPAKTLQVIFDSSNESPFFQSEDAPMQDVEETLDEGLKLE